MKPRPTRLDLLVAAGKLTINADRRPTAPLSEIARITVKK